MTTPTSTPHRLVHGVPPGYWLSALVTVSWLTDSQYRVLAALSAWLDSQTGRTPTDRDHTATTDTIATSVGHHRQHLSTAIAAAETAGWLVVTRRHRRPNRYELTIPADHPAAAALTQRRQASNSRTRGTGRPHRATTQRLRPRTPVGTRPSGSNKKPPYPPPTEPVATTTCPTRGEDLIQALETAIRRPLRRCRDLQAVANTLAQAGWTGPAIVATAIGGYDNRGMPWPEQDAVIDDSGLAAWRLNNLAASGTASPNIAATRRRRHESAESADAAEQAAHDSASVARDRDAHHRQVARIEAALGRLDHAQREQIHASVLAALPPPLRRQAIANRWWSSRLVAPIVAQTLDLSDPTWDTQRPETG